MDDPSFDKIFEGSRDRLPLESPPNIIQYGIASFLAVGDCADNGHTARLEKKLHFCFSIIKT
jgi:hypothetical protein